MESIRNSCWLVWSIFLLVSCAGSKSITNSSDTSKNTAKVEDLSVFRPTFPAAPALGNNVNIPEAVTPTLLPANHVNNRVNALLDTVANANKAIRYAQGFRILAYTGTERKVAMDLRKAVIDRIPEERDYLQYQQPTFRLKIGDYLSRIEAQQVLSRIQDITPNAMIISDQININR